MGEGRPRQQQQQQQQGQRRLTGLTKAGAGGEELDGSHAVAWAPAVAGAAHEDTRDCRSGRWAGRQAVNQAVRHKSRSEPMVAF